MIREFDQFFSEHQVLSDELKILEIELPPLISQINEKKQLIDELEEEKKQLTMELDEEKNELTIELEEENCHVELEEDNRLTKIGRK